MFGSYNKRCAVLKQNHQNGAYFLTELNEENVIKNADSYFK